MQFLTSLYKNRLLKGIALALMFGLPVFSYGMEAEIGASVRGFMDGAIGDLGEGSREIFEKSFRDIFEATPGEFGSLGTLDSQLAESMRNDLAKLVEEYKGKKPFDAAFEQKVNSMFSKGKADFIQRVNSLNETTTSQFNALKKIKKLPGFKTMTDPDAIGKVIPDKGSIPFGLERPSQVSPDPARDTLEMQADKMAIAKEDLATFDQQALESYQIPDHNSEEYKALVQEYNKQVDAYTKMEKDYFNTRGQSLQDAIKERIQAENAMTNPAAPGTSGNGNAIEKLSTDVERARIGQDAIEEENSILSSKTNRDAYYDAKAEYEAAWKNEKAYRKRIEEQKGKIAEKQAEIDALPENDPGRTPLETEKTQLESQLSQLETQLKETEANIDITRQAAKDAYQKYVDEATWFREGKWYKGLSAESELKAWEGFIKPGILGGVVSGIQGIIFALPGWVMEGWHGYSQKQALLDSLRASQHFGGISMYVLDGLINEKDPINSHFIYVGNKTADQKVTDQEKEYRDYYVSINPETGAVAEIPVFNEACTLMLHLNSGLVFTGDGEPINLKSPTLEMLGTEVSAEFVSEGPPFSQITLQKALNRAAGLAGPLSGDVNSWMVWEQASGFPGEPVVADLMRSGNDVKIPKLLQRLVQSLQSGGYFGKMNIQGINPLGSDQFKFLNAAVQGVDVGHQLPLTQVPDVYDYSIARGTYIYQTQDTPYVQTLLQQIKSDDPNAQIMRNSLYDYVVFVNDPNNPVPVPLYIPSIKDGHAPTWDMNPNAQYMISLVEPTVSVVDEQGHVSHLLNMYDSSGKMYVGKMDESDAVVNAVKAMKNGSAWLEQINLVKAYFAEYAQNGPFDYGNYTLSIDPEFATKNVPIYKVQGSLEGGGDDYVVSLLDAGKGFMPLMLPRMMYTEGHPAKQMFVSLVTSRFYTIAQSGNQLELATGGVMVIPDLTDTPYWIVTNNGISSITTTPQSSAATGTAPLYTLFVDEAFNPTELPTGVKSLPTGSQWALNNLKINDPMDNSATPKMMTIEQVLTQYAGDAGLKNLQDAVNASYANWKQAIEEKYPEDIDRMKGPFDWIGGLTPIQISATSANDIKNNIFVYISPEYPGEYLVISASKSGVQGTVAFDQANPQQYAISLSTGNVYDRTSAGAKVANLNVNTILQSAGIPTSAPIYTQIQNSQAVALAKIRQNLYGPAVQFGFYQLYVRASDYMDDQFIYADVTGLGDPLVSGSIKENPSVISKIADYFVCMEQVPQKDSKGNPVVDENGQPEYVPGQYTFGTQLGADTYAVVSLVTGAAFTRGGYLANYRDLNLGAKDPLNFAEIILKTLIPQPVDPALYQRIKTLTDVEYNKYLKEIEDIKKKQQEEQRLKQDLSQNILLNLAQAKYVPDNPNEEPRYLVQYSKDKYYMVSPAPDLTKDPQAPPQIIVDYNFNPEGEPKDSGIGIIYQVITKDGSTKAVFQQVLQDDMLAAARAYVGVAVQKDGSEKLVLPIKIASMPMKFTKNGASVSALQDTGITKQHIDTTKQVFNFKFWYNVLTSSYLAQMTRANGVTFYIDVATGLCYDWDGISDMATLRLNQTSLYKGDATGDLLFVGQDQFNVLKVAFKNPSKPDNGYEPYTLIWKVDPQGDIVFGSIRTANGILDFNNFKGSQFVLNSDYTADLINLGYVYLDPAGNTLPSAQHNIQPFYAVWTRDDDNHFFFQDKYDVVPDLNYSLLIYQQSRAVGQPVINGTYVEDDNRHTVCLEESTDPNATDPFTVVVDKPCSATGIKASLMKTVGIVFDKSKTFKQLYYKGQLIDLSAPAKTADGTVYSGSYTTVNSDKTTRKNPITLTVSTYVFPGTKIPMTLMSLADGQTIYDYTYDFHVLNTSILPDSKDLDLYSLMRGWKLRVTPFIPNTYMQSTKKVVDGVTTWVPNSPTGTYATSALASSLGIGSQLSPVKCPEGAIGCDANALAQAAKSITVYTDTNEKTIYIPNTSIQGKKFKRFVYKLGANQWDQGKSYYPMTKAGTSFLNGYLVDLTSGILYGPAAANVNMYPVGLSLLPSQLAELLDTLDLSVHLDADGYPDSLQYRSMSTIDDNNLTKAKAAYKKALKMKKYARKPLSVGIKPLMQAQPPIHAAKKPQLLKSRPVQRKVPAKITQPPTRLPAQIKQQPKIAVPVPRIAVPSRTTRPVRMR